MTATKFKAKKRIPPVGELRQSQVLTTLGPGAMVDLPNHAVVIGGLEHWHGERQRIYEDRLRTRACLHAKCIVADEDRALVSSANFTEAAHERNIEAGLLIADRQVAMALRAQFDTLVERGVLRRVPGL